MEVGDALIVLLLSVSSSDDFVGDFDENDKLGSINDSFFFHFLSLVVDKALESTKYMLSFRESESEDMLVEYDETSIPFVFSYGNGGKWQRRERERERERKRGREGK